MPRKLKSTKPAPKQRSIEFSGPDDAVVRSQAAKISRAKQEVNSAGAVLRTEKKNAKALGINGAALGDAMRLAAMTRDAASTYCRDLAAYLVALGVFVSSPDFESGLDPIPNTPSNDSVEEAGRRGYEDGLAGQPQNHPYSDESEQAIAYERGWQRGQAKLGNEMAPEPETVDA